NSSPWIAVPPALAPETRAPDSIQFNLVDMSDDEVALFSAIAKERGVGVQVFGLSEDNARAYWTWEFLPEAPGPLPQTRDMLMRACDTRLPVRLKRPELDFIADVLIEAAEDVKGASQAYGT
ncbi:MAG: aminotransferase, partial [Maritimibacter sp.]